MSPATRRMGLPKVATVALAALTAAAAAADGNAVRGQTLYEERCSGCHSLDSHRVGPLHRGVVGRRAGSAPGYEYSPALARAKIVWDARALDAWLADPEKLFPGQRMGYRVTDAADRADLIAYLQRESMR